MVGGIVGTLAGVEVRASERPMPPGGVSDVWQIQDLERCVFGSVAMIGLTGEFSDVWQIRELGDRE